VFEDDFGGTALDGRWKIWNGGAFNNELQLYQGANLSLADGQLRIDARSGTATGPVDPWSSTTKTFSYTSGRIESATTFSSGRTTPEVRMAARILMPSSYGLWPAFWSYGDPWPTQGEIDVVEARSHVPAAYQTNYFYGRRSGVNLVRGKEGLVNLWSTATMATCPHIYEVVWTKTSLTFYLDGTPVDIKTGDYIPNMFGKRQKVVLNLAVGGNFLAPLTQAIEPGTMVVDWVKVFTRN
jgi:beta-glucanase (GH16 family)